MCQWHERCSFGKADWIFEEHLGFHAKDSVSFYSALQYFQFKLICNDIVRHFKFMSNVFVTNFIKFEFELSGKNFIVLSYLLTKFTVIVDNKWKVVLVTWTWNNCSNKLASNLVLSIAWIAWCLYMRYTTLSKEQCLGIKTFSYHILCCALDNPQMH